MKSLDVPPTSAAMEKALLLPGNDLPGEFYAPVARALGEEGFQTTLLTLPGFCRVPANENPGWDSTIQDILRAIEKHLSGGGTLIGHSLGGLLAFLAAARRPADVTRLILLEPAIVPSRRASKMVARRYIRRVIDGDRDQFHNWSGLSRRIHRPEAFPQWAMDLYMEMRRTGEPGTARVLFEELDQNYPLPFDRIEVPTLLIRGARSGLGSRIGLSRLRGKFRNAKLVTIPEAAHFLVNEQDEAVADAISRFVRYEDA